MAITNARINSKSCNIPEISLQISLNYKSKTKFLYEDKIKLLAGGI